MSLVYGDAQQFLGVTATVTFEEAVLECVRSGFPKVLSIGVVINELFERIGHLLYSQGFVDNPALAEVRLRPAQAGTRPCSCWETDPSCRRHVRDVNALAASGVERFLDPIDYLRYLPGLRSLEDDRAGWSDGISGQPRPGQRRPIPRSCRDPKVTDLVPRMLRGCAHGDLHGRNILVGIVRDQAMWPTVFDYEDMSPSQPDRLGLRQARDRAEDSAPILDLFGGRSPARFVQQVQRFEIELSLVDRRMPPQSLLAGTAADRHTRRAAPGHPAPDPPHGGSAPGSQPRPPQ